MQPGPGGFRVAEDVARFVLNDPSALDRFKKLRHEVTLAEKSLFKSAKSASPPGMWGRIWAGETKKKPKRSGYTPQELLKANLKRAQEALRSLEEFSKLLKHPASARFKRIRYECYEIEEERL